MNTSPPPLPSRLSTLELLQLDRQHVWHPYAAAGPTTSTTTSSMEYHNVVPIESANGVYLKVRSGSSYDTSSSSSSSSSSSDVSHELVDGMSNWWATIHGYNHMTLNQALVQQISQMSHVMLGGLTHEPVVQLCTKLCQLTQLDVCFLSDSGSVAVEVAMKMAIQYWNGRYAISSSLQQQQQHSTNTKTKFLTVRNGYHGDTFAAMSVCDPINGMHQTYFRHDRGILQQAYFVKAPTPHYPNSHLISDPTRQNSENTEEFDESHLKELMDTLEQYHMNIAAMIIEPIVQGAGGMRMYHPTYLRRVRELCTDYDVLLIYDEIATGFGRTNQFFGHDHCCSDPNNTELAKQYKPDIICLGKALTGGYMSLAATITTNHVAEVIHTVSSTSSNDNNNYNNHSTTTTTKAYQPVLMHGPTFMGNPLACSVALASISLLENSHPPPPPPPLAPERSHPRSTTSMNDLPTQSLLPQHTSTCTDWRRSVPMIEQQLRQELMECTTSEHVQSVRVLGAIGVVEMKHPINDMKLLQHTIVKDYGVWLRPFGKLIYTMPPYIISTEQLRKITTAMVQLTRRRF